LGIVREWFIIGSGLEQITGLDILVPSMGFDTMADLDPILSIPIKEFQNAEEHEFPKYTTQIINIANQNAGGTRPKVVGQMSELILDCLDEYDNSSDELTFWGEWYAERYPTGVDDAVRKIMPMINNMKEAIKLIDEEMVRNWVKDLLIVKTYEGLRVQHVILKKVAEMKHTTYTHSTPDEESKGIDGYIGDVPVSVKPLSYKTKNMLRERIDVKMIFYDKKKDHIEVHTHELD
jgi:hypothetical protein